MKERKYFNTEKHRNRVFELLMLNGIIKNGQIEAPHYLATYYILASDVLYDKFSLYLNNEKHHNTNLKYKINFDKLNVLYTDERELLLVNIADSILSGHPVELSFKDLIKDDIELISNALRIAEEANDMSVFVMGETSELDKTESGILQFVKAIELISSYVACEYLLDDPKFINNLHSIPIAYNREFDTTVYINLIDFKISKYDTDNWLLAEKQYDSLDDLINQKLINLDFNDLINFDEEEEYDISM